MHYFPGVHDSPQTLPVPVPMNSFFFFVEICKIIFYLVLIKKKENPFYFIWIFQVTYMFVLRKVETLLGRKQIKQLSAGLYQTWAVLGAPTCSSVAILGQLIYMTCISARGWGAARVGSAGTFRVQGYPHAEFAKPKM